MQKIDSLADGQASGDRWSQWLDDYYGGLKLGAASNIVFSNGLVAQSKTPKLTQLNTVLITIDTTPVRLSLPQTLCILCAAVLAVCVHGPRVLRSGHLSARQFCAVAASCRIALPLPSSHQSIISCFARVHLAFHAVHASDADYHQTKWPQSHRIVAYHDGVGNALCPAGPVVIRRCDGQPLQLGRRRRA